MYLNLIYDIEEILNYPQSEKYSDKERLINVFQWEQQNKGLKGEQLKKKKVGRRLAYPGTPKQRRAIRKNLSKFLDYLDFPHESRKEKNKLYRIIRSMYIYQYIARKNNILFKIERDKILNQLDKNKVDIEKYLIATRFQYNLINKITSALYDEKKNIYDESIRDRYTIQQLKDILSNDISIRYIKKIESLIKE